MTHTFTRIAFSLLTLLALAGAALAADPGVAYPATAEISDQKAGSVLVYNLYSSSATSANTNNSRINITNTNSFRQATVHLFFVDGSTCSVADSFICLTPNQTASFLASDVDPGISGYIVAVATHGGFPISFNFLIGDEYVKLSSGHEANLGAEAIAAVAANPALILSGAVQSLLAFDGKSYNRLPRVLALDNIPARADGNDTLLVINCIGGADLSISGSGVGRLFGFLFDDAETAFSWTFDARFVCQLRASISNNFPRTAPRVETVIPGGRSGWMKFWSNSTNDLTGGARSLLGASINRNASAGEKANAFKGGHNLHKLTLNPVDAIIVPNIPANCQEDPDPKFQ